MQRRGQQYLRLDGQEGASFEVVARRTLTFSPDSKRLAHAALRDNLWTVVLDGAEGQRWEGIGQILFSPDSRHLAYVARRRGRWRVVLDERAGPQVDGVFRGTLTFSRDSKKLIYVAKVGGTSRVFKEQQAGPPFLRISSLRLGASGQVYYIGHMAGTARAVMDNEQGPEYQEVSELALGPAGRRVAYLARKDKKWRAVIDGTPGDAYDEVAGLRFGPGPPPQAPQSAELVYAARLQNRAFVVSSVGGPGEPYDAVRVSTLAFTQQGKLLYVARRNRRFMVVFDHRPGPGFDEVRRPVVAGEHWGYIAHTGHLYRVFIDGVPLEYTYTWAGGLVFSPDGRRHMYLAREGSGVKLIQEDGAALAFDVVVSGTLVYSRDSKHWACVAGKARKRELFFVIDGEPQESFDTAQLRESSRGTGQQDQAALLRRWAAAELENRFGQ